MEDDSSAMDVGCGGPFSMMLCGSDDQENDGMFGGILAAFGLGGGASSTAAQSGGAQTPGARGSQARAPVDYAPPPQGGAATSQAKDAMPTHGQGHHAHHAHHAPAAGPSALPSAQLAGGELADAAGGDDEIDDDSDQEPAEDYKVGGYHPVHPGETYGGKYVVVRKLGWGVYSTVWLATDTSAPGAPGAARVALKIQRSAPEYYRAAHNEVQLLGNVMKKVDEQVANIAPGGGGGARPVLAACEPPIARFLASFDHAGPHGTHPCMVFEALGHSLLMVLDQRGRLDPPTARDVSAQLLHGLDFLHQECGIIHTDVKPENVLVVPDAGADASGGTLKIKIADFGNAIFVEQQNVKAIQTREYRCPESILGVWPFASAADIWSLGCVTYEMLTGNLLFDPPSPGPEDRFSKDESHLASVVQLMGFVPGTVLARGKHTSKFFDLKTGQLRQLSHVMPFAKRGVTVDLTKAMPVAEAQLINAFLLQTFEYDHVRRPSARELMLHPWIEDSPFSPVQA